MSNTEHGLFKEDEQHLFARIGKAAKFLVSAPHVHIPNTGAAPMLDAYLDVPVFEPAIETYAEIADDIRIPGVIGNVAIVGYRGES